MLYDSASIFTKRIVAAKQMWRIYMFGDFGPIEAYSIQFISFDLDPIQSLVLRKEKKRIRKEIRRAPSFAWFSFYQDDTLLILE